ncbi:uncharacterized protein LOC131588129 isoform X2 [Poecile atricapillus]|uniref:uncharacterized protein LOC131588129 isoform X2 n=1 Tax=Poecile atricapillus TaxID=48891 RepID=UPI002738FB23|nr:uncharacterized protein LOC131588129 isoform X2 [Poecile atricapillus]
MIAGIQGGNKPRAPSPCALPALPSLRLEVFCSFPSKRRHNLEEKAREKLGKEGRCRRRCWRSGCLTPGMKTKPLGGDPGASRVRNHQELGLGKREWQEGERQEGEGAKSRARGTVEGSWQGNKRRSFIPPSCQRLGKRRLGKEQGGRQQSPAGDREGSEERDNPEPLAQGNHCRIPSVPADAPRPGPGSSSGSWDFDSGGFDSRGFDSGGFGPRGFDSRSFGSRDFGSRGFDSGALLTPQTLPARCTRPSPAPFQGIPRDVPGIVPAGGSGSAQPEPPWVPAGLSSILILILLHLSLFPLWQQGRELWKKLGISFISGFFCLFFWGGEVLRAALLPTWNNLGAPKSAGSCNFTPLHFHLCCIT